MTRYGGAGRLRIPFLLIDKPLSLANGNAQTVVDAPNSAAYLRWKTTAAISDHASDEGMYRLMYAIPKLTRCTVEHDGQTTRYLCTKKQRGLIRGGKMHDAQGRSLDSITGIDLVLYTCTGRKPHGDCEVWLTYWTSK